MVDHTARLDFARERAASLRNAAVPRSRRASQRHRDRHDDVDRRKPVHITLRPASRLRVRGGAL